MSHRVFLSRFFPLFSLFYFPLPTPQHANTHTHIYKITTSIFISPSFFFFFLFSASSSSLVSQLEPDWRDARELLFPLFFLISKDAKERYCFVCFFLFFCYCSFFLFVFFIIIPFILYLWIAITTTHKKMMAMDSSDPLHPGRTTSSACGPEWK